MLTEDTAALYDSMDSYYPDLQAALDDSEELLNRTTEALNTGISTAAIVQNTLKTAVTIWMQPPATASAAPWNFWIRA